MAKRLLRQKQVLDKLGIGKSWLYEGMRRGIFPLPVHPDPESPAVRWDEDELDAVVERCLAARNAERSA
jgi:predicted DNA-binding transcriptional regulator AlpA